MIAPKDYIEDEVYGQRLLISTKADQRELRSNIRAARAILYSTPLPISPSSSMPAIEQLNPGAPTY